MVRGREQEGDPRALEHGARAIGARSSGIPRLEEIRAAAAERLALVPVLDDVRTGGGGDDGGGRREVEGAVPVAAGAARVDRVGIRMLEATIASRSASAPPAISAGVSPRAARPRRRSARAPRRSRRRGCREGRARLGARKLASSSDAVDGGGEVHGAALIAWRSAPRELEEVRDEPRALRREDRLGWNWTPKRGATRAARP
jgi:hypothetical protein